MTNARSTGRLGRGFQRTSAAALTLALLAGCSRPGARVEPATGAAPAAADTIVVRGDSIPAGTTLVAQLDQPIGTDVSRPGQRYTATLQSPIVDATGDAVVPTGSKIEGRVAQLDKGDLDDPAVVELTVDSIRVGDESQPVQARIVGTDVEASRPGVKPAPVIGGAVGGAALGAILGGGKGAIVGGLLGAGAGTLISLGTGKTQARLPEGTALAVETESAVPLAGLRARAR